MRILIAALVGAITGAVATDVFGPQLLNWWATPPVRTSCDCSPNMAYAMSHLVLAQLIFTVLGAVAFAVLYLLLFRRRRVALPARVGPA